MPNGIPLRRLLTAFLLCGALLTATTACNDKAKDDVSGGSPTASTTVEQQKLAKTRFVANAGLAAGATYQWIIKPARDGKFKKGADGRTFALVKGGLAGAFAYNRLKAASENAKGDPTLSKLMAPLTSGIAALKDLPSQLRKGDSTDDVVSTFQKTIDDVKEAGKQAGAEVKDKIPSTSELGG
ncbi:hypothetical protein [Streptomyces sp. H39-S7]|uniref:hypothetical protein n=1 Tax=Streptomyces sp. H39-S7 TaxID=3004357 RepID=UPI0022AEE5E6|nr:hypothetical protein [Streptomyces sp. H39-S7]MCZ4122631.1 hypothetical protein [Streptomyces sp. H39-S7]